MTDYLHIVPLFLGVIGPFALAIFSALSGPELQQRMPIVGVVHAIVCLIYCLAALGPSGSTLISDASLVISPPIVSTNFSLMFEFNATKIWWFLGLSCLGLLLMMSILRFNVKSTRTEIEQVILYLLSFAFASLSLFANGMLVSCILFEIWFLLHLYMAITYADDNGSEIVRKAFSSRIALLVVGFFVLFVLRIENLVASNSLPFYAILGYVGISMIYRPVVHFWAHVNMGAIGLLIGTRLVLQSISSIEPTDFSAPIGFALPIVVSALLAVFSVLSRSVVRTSNLYFLSLWFLILGAFVVSPAPDSNINVLIISSALLSNIMLIVTLSMKEVLAEAKMDVLVPILGVFLHLLALGIPLSIGFYNFVNVSAMGLFFQVSYYFCAFLLSVSVIRLIHLSQNDAVFWDVKSPLVFREAAPWFIAIILLLSNEYFAVGGLLGQSVSAKWHGILVQSQDLFDQSGAIPLAAIFAAVVVIAIILGFVLSKRNLRGEWNSIDFPGGSFSLLPEISVHRVARLNFLLLWVPLRGVKMTKAALGISSEKLGSVVSQCEKDVFNRVVWTECMAYMKSFSLFFRFIHNGNVRLYLFYAFVIFSAFIYIYWETID